MVVTWVSTIVIQACRKALLHRRGRRLAVPQFFPDALKDQHVRVHAHTDRQDDSGDARQRQCGPGEAEETQQNDQVQNQREVGVDAGAA